MHSVSYFDVHVSDPTSALDFYSRVLAGDSSRSILCHRILANRY